jgi:antitoxin VapB
MEKESSNDEPERSMQLDRVYGSMPWLKPGDRKHYRVKIFKSGNSVAVRLPAALGLKPGAEMDLDVENDEVLSLTPIEPTKRKFNIGKVAGSAHDLRFLSDDDRLFDDEPVRDIPGQDPDAGR